MKHVESEISILLQLRHSKNFVSIRAYGSDGRIMGEKTENSQNLTYIIFEYVPAGSLYEMCSQAGVMGEGAGQFFAR